MFVFMVILMFCLFDPSFCFGALASIIPWSVHGVMARADVHACTHTGEQPLATAAMGEDSNEEIVRALLNAGADVNHQVGTQFHGSLK